MARKTKQPEMKRWRVRYREVHEGETEVEAATAEEAWRIVDSGDFEEDPGSVRTDYMALGTAHGVREVES